MRGKEGAPKPEKSIDIFRKLYYLILLIFLGYIIYYFIFRSFVVRGSGFVVSDIITINSSYNGNIIDMYKKNYIKKGDKICIIKERIKNNITKPTKNLKLLDLQLQYKAKLNEYNILKKEIEKLNIISGLELFNPNENRLDNLKNKLNQIKLSLKILSMQIKEYKKIKPQVTSLFSYVEHKVISNVSGEIIKRNNNNVVKVGDLLVKIKTMNNLRVEAYFYQKSIEYLKIKDVVTLLLPDDTTKEGYIKNITFEKDVLNSQIQQMIKVTIIPIDKNISFWKKYDFLKIKVRKYKW
jgi:hypothetical protein